MIQEEDLGKKRQNLELYQRGLEQEIMNEQSVMTEELYKKITAYLKDYAEERQLQVVLKYNPGSDLLYGGANIDITNDVISGLNEIYKKDQSAPNAKSKADSTAAKKK